MGRKLYTGSRQKQWDAADWKERVRGRSLSRIRRTIRWSWSWTTRIKRYSRRRSSKRVTTIGGNLLRAGLQAFLRLCTSYVFAHPFEIVQRSMPGQYFPTVTTGPLVQTQSFVDG